jgi:hypothetical protein
MVAPANLNAVPADFALETFGIIDVDSAADSIHWRSIEHGLEQRDRLLEMPSFTTGFEVGDLM